jgi:hypothetical protein
MSGRQPTVFDSYPCLRSRAAFNSRNSNVVNEDIGALLPFRSDAGVMHFSQLAAYGTESERGKDRRKYAGNRKDGGPISDSALILVAVVSTIFSFMFMRRALALSGWWATYFWFSGIACAAGAARLIVTIMSPYTS